MEKINHRSWWGILTNLQKQELIKRHHKNLLNVDILVNHPKKGMITYHMPENDYNLLKIAKFEKINLEENL